MEPTNDQDFSMLNFILFTVAGIAGYFGINAKELDLFLAICLKLISILSFGVIIIINIPKLIKTIKSLWYANR